jgi:hypothetical protein
LEYKSKFPKSTITSIPEVGHLVLFRYRAVTSEKKVYDRNPLCFIVLNSNEVFYGMNLHYYSPKQRMGVINMLIEAKNSQVQNWEDFLFGSIGFHKYLKSEVESNFIDIAMEEWQSASILPAEEFVRNFRGAEVPVSPRSIW